MTINLMTVREAAAALRLSKSYLDKLRWYGGGPCYVRLGRRVLYDPADLAAWRNANRFGGDGARRPSGTDGTDALVRAYLDFPSESARQSFLAGLPARVRAEVEAAAAHLAD